MSMQAFVKNLFILLFIAGISICQTNKTNIKDLIAPLKVTPGKEKIINVSDLIYLDNSLLSFKENSVHKIKYNKETNNLTARRDYYTH